MNNYLSIALSGLLVVIVSSSASPAIAQEKNGVKRSIIINSGDTLVNGKKFSDLNRNEQAKLRKEFREMENKFRTARGAGSDADVFLRHRGWIDDDRELPVLFWNDSLDKDLGFSMKGSFPEDFRVFKFNGDTTLALSFNDYGFGGPDSNLRKRIITMHRELAPGRLEGFGRIGIPGKDFETRIFRGFPEEKNSSSFDYNYTDKDGISSRMSIRLSDAGKEQLKKITGSETIAGAFEASDLTVFPNFSSGKMTLSFNADSRGAIRVQVLDSDMKPVFTDDVSNLNGTYVKQLLLPRNGIYYVTISRNGSWFVKKMVKE